MPTFALLIYFTYWSVLLNFSHFATLATLATSHPQENHLLSINFVDKQSGFICIKVALSYTQHNHSVLLCDWLLHNWALQSALCRDHGIWLFAPPVLWLDGTWEGKKKHFVVCFYYFIKRSLSVWELPCLTLD